MDKCLKRKDSILKYKKFFVSEYVVVDTETHFFVSEKVEILKADTLQYVSNSRIFCMYCGKIVA